MNTMVERIVRATVDGDALPLFLCTPEALDEMVAGYLLTQGQISGGADIIKIDVDPSALTVAVTTARGYQPPLSPDARLKSLAPVRRGIDFSMDDARRLAGRLAGVKGHYGTHCLGLQTPETTHFREDIGRHNAMDKVIGRGLMDGVDFSLCAVAATGRISLEMLLKAAGAGIPYVVSKKYPSDLAISAANLLDIRIIGEALSGEPVLYSAPCPSHPPLVK